MRANVEAARDAGVHLIFMTGNEVFWRTRTEPSIAGPTTPDRTLVCYKESIDHAKIDPSPEWTGTWRDPRFTPPAQGGGAPENSLTGQLFAGIFPTGEADPAIKVPAEYSRLRFWRNTDIADLDPGEVAELAGSSLGFEFDIDSDKGRPASSIRLSSTTVSVPRVLQDYADTYAPGVITHNMTMYRAPSGALVWGTGTTQWSYGLDDHHITDEGVPADRDMQQATLNALGDMGVQPATRQGDLVAGKHLSRPPPARHHDLFTRGGRHHPGGHPGDDRRHLRGRRRRAGRVGRGLRRRRDDVEAGDGHVVVELRGGPSVPARLPHDPSPRGRRQLQPRGQRPDPHGHGRPAADALLDLEQQCRARHGCG